MGGVSYTIRDGIVFDAKALLGDVRGMVAGQRTGARGRRPFNKPATGSVRRIEDGHLNKHLNNFDLLITEETMDFDIPEDIAELLTRLDNFIEDVIKPLEQQDDNIRFFDHRREDARTDWERGGLPNEEWEQLLFKAKTTG